MEGQDRHPGLLIAASLTILLKHPTCVGPMVRFVRKGLVLVATSLILEHP
jgi:hypothetical protein